MDSIYSAFTNAERATLDNEAMRNELAMQPLKQQQLQGQVNALNELVKSRQFENKKDQETYDRQTGARQDIAAGVSGLQAIDRTKPFAEQQAAIGQQLNVLQGLLGKATEAGLPGEEKNLQARIDSLQKSASAAQAERVNSLYNTARLAHDAGPAGWKQFIDSIPATFPEYAKDVLQARALGINLDDPKSPQVQQMLGNMQAAVVGQKERLDLENKAADREESIRSAKAKERAEAQRIGIANRAQTLAEQKYADEKAATQGEAAGGQGGALPKGRTDPFAGAQKNADGSITTKLTDGTVVNIPKSEQYTMDSRGRLYYPDGTVEIGEMQQAKSRNMRAEDAFRQATGALARTMDLANKSTSGMFQGRNSVGLLWSGGGALANVLSSSQVKQYNSIVAGFVKDMAVAQAQGAHVPEGEIKELKDSMTIREGDDPATTLTKLANIKSNFQTTARTIYNNRGVPFPRREAVWQAAKEIEQLIPFEVEDVQKAKKLKAQGKTFKDWVQAVGKDVQKAKAEETDAEAQAAAAAVLKKLGR